MDFGEILGIAAGVAIVLRILRRMFKWVDYLIIAIMIIVPIIVGISEGLGAGILTFFGTAFILGLLTGIGSKTEIRRFGNKYSLECRECGYGGLKILNEEDNIVLTKCKRCGTVCSHILNR